MTQRLHLFLPFIGLMLSFSVLSPLPAQDIADAVAKKKAEVQAKADEEAKAQASSSSKPPASIMTPQLWIAFGFIATLMVFLMVTYFVKDTSSHGQATTLRFLTAFCGGLGGGFLTGDALFRFQGQIADGANIAISGTAGCALFFAIWFTYPKPAERV